MSQLTNQQILEKAINLAIDGGWKPSMVDSRMHGKPRAITDHIVQFTKGLADYRAIVFNHEFAGCLWGDEETGSIIRTNDGSYDLKPLWQYHLQQMVIASDPIEYLGANI